jgi:hypothetical protein
MNFTEGQDFYFLPYITPRPPIRKVRGSNLGGRVKCLAFTFSRIYKTFATGDS